MLLEEDTHYEARMETPLCLGVGVGVEEEIQVKISFWLLEVINFACESANEQSFCLDCLRNLKYVALPFYDLQNPAVNQVLQAGISHSLSTSTVFFLKNVTHKGLDAFSINPVVALVLLCNIH